MEQEARCQARLEAVRSREVHSDLRGVLELEPNSNGLLVDSRKEALRSRGISLGWMTVIWWACPGVTVNVAMCRVRYEGGSSATGVERMQGLEQSRSKSLRSDVGTEKAVFGTRPADVRTWNATLAENARKGDGGKVFQLFERMKEAGVVPNERTYVSLLKACTSLAVLEGDTVLLGQTRKVGSLKRGKLIHAEIARLGYESDVFVGTTLVDMYAKCRNMLDARQVFDGLQQRNVVSWNALIAGYVQQGQAEEALDLFACMQGEGVAPNNWTFVSALKACGILACKEEASVVGSQAIKCNSLHGGKMIHAKVVAQGLASDSFICNTLVHMYSKCGSMLDSRLVFDAFTRRTVVSWSAMIAGYVQNEDGRMALQLFNQMQNEGFTPDKWTLASVLKACGSLSAQEQETTTAHGRSVKPHALQTGKVVHAIAVTQGYESDVFVGTSLIDMYAKCGSMEDACHVFDALSKRNVVSWNALISGSVHQGNYPQALHLYARMQQEGVQPTNQTFVSALKACSGLAGTGTPVIGQMLKKDCLQLGRTIHADVARCSQELDLFVGTALVHMYSKCGSMIDAEHVFYKMPQQDVVSWSAMISGFAEQGQGAEALQFYAKMRVKGVKPDGQAFASVLKACGRLAATEDSTIVNGQLVKPDALEQVRVTHAEILKRGYISDFFVGTTLANSYAECGSMMDALSVFHTLPQDNVVLWNVLVAGYVDQEHHEKAMQLYDEMQKASVIPDEATFLSILKACSNAGALSLCRQIHGDIINGKVELTTVLATTLIHAYSKCGSLLDAQLVFDTLAQQDIVSWTALIAGYAQLGDSDRCLQCFEEMQRKGVKPDAVTYVAVLNACSHAGMVEKGIQYFQCMEADPSIQTTLEHYVSLVDLLGRAGLFRQVQDLVQEMPMQPDVALWLSLLGSCRKHGNVGLGEHAFKEAVSLEPKQTSAYLMMLNIYHEANMWEEASRLCNTIEELRVRTGPWKRKPGQSWIEHEKRVHVFLVGDRSNEQSDQIYSKLLELSEQLSYPKPFTYRSSSKLRSCLQTCQNVASNVFQGHFSLQMVN